MTKCDGNHGVKTACSDPECWLKDDDPEPSQELKDAIAEASVDLSAETAELKPPQDVVPAQAGIVASGPVNSGEPGSVVTYPPPTPPKSLFDNPSFDPDEACHQIFRKTETVRLARASYEAAKEDASDKKKILDTRAKELEDLIKELQWKQDRAEKAQREPKLVAAPEPIPEATDGVEGMGELPTEDPLVAADDDDGEDEEPASQEHQDDMGSLADA